MRYLCLAALCLGLSSCDYIQFKPGEIEREDIKTLSVTGIGEVRVFPDQFVLTGAVIQQKDTVREAMNAVADIVNAVQTKAAAKANLTGQEFNFVTVNTVGVKDPECLLFNQEADRTNNTLQDGERRVTKKVCEDISQQASISFTFTAGPSDLAGDLLSAFSEAGVIRLNLDGYKVKNIDEIELQAGELAIANARAKAERLAKSGGAKIVGVLDLNAYQPTYNQRTARARRLIRKALERAPPLLMGVILSRSLR